MPIHPKLVQDTVPIGQLPLCHVLLMNNAWFPWVVLVPKQDGLREITDLSAADRVRWLEETSAVMEVMQSLYQPEKMNMAALGNMVPQLHIHVIARYENDKAWPDPVWGKGGEVYSDAALQSRIAELQKGFFGLEGFQKA